MECFYMKNIFSAFVVAAVVFSSSVFAADAPAKPIATAPVASAAKPVAAATQEAININTADAQTLTKLKGIGPKKAEAIVAFRKANGAFKTVDQLADVKGIGAKTLEANRKSIHI
jgi:competence protein ComEA